MPPSHIAFVAPQPRRRPAAIDTRIDTYAMANLSSRTTGLPLTVWVSPRGRARHAARVKVSLTPGKMDVDNVAVVGIRPEPRRLTPGLGDAEFALIARWIRLNEAALLEFWNEAIDTAELIAKLKKL